MEYYKKLTRTILIIALLTHYDNKYLFFIRHFKKIIIVLNYTKAGLKNKDLCLLLPEETAFPEACFCLQLTVLIWALEK